MEIKINKQKESIIVIHITGKFTIEHEQEFEKQIQPLLLDKQTRALLINMSKMHHIDSTGIGMIMKMMNMAKFAGIDLYLYSLPDNIQHIFSIGYLDSFFRIKSLDEMQSIFPGVKL